MSNNSESEGPGSGDDRRRPRTKPPYSARHPIPNIQRYHERQQARRDEEKDRLDSDGEDDTVASGEAPNRNIRGSEKTSSKQQDGARNANSAENDDDGSESDRRDTSEIAGNASNARDKRKAFKKSDPIGERTVTDPVTHLRAKIHDFTQDELKKAPYSLQPPRARDEAKEEKPEETLSHEQKQVDDGDRATRRLFPPPSFELLRKDLSQYYGAATKLALGMQLLLAPLLAIVGYLGAQYFESKTTSTIVATVILLAIYLSLGSANVWLTSGWLAKKAEAAWENRMWEAAAQQEVQERGEGPESAMWLNNLISNVWPLINPDLFTSIADTLEDVMQASLPPKLIRMVAVTDIGQGAIAPRILGARWLPSGAAAQNISLDGEKKGSKNRNDRQDPENGQSDANATEDQHDDQSDGEKKSKENQESEQNVAEGLEAEKGDFVNLELVLAYRAPQEQGVKSKAKNAHLFLDFYLPGSIPAPVFVSLRGFVCRVRVRMQLTPDPPFVSLLTLTLLGQPRADISCVPITRKLISLTDIPLISSFVQSSIDAALSEYVAPRSLTLNIKQMLEGDDFKKNTEARGVVVVEVRRGYEFKEADTGILGLSEASTDGYVSVGWAKFGKAFWSTRVIIKDMHPVWQETAFVPVGTEEVNADESLRVQLWDSDRMSADDDLGRIEVPLKELMTKWKGKMYPRCDGFMAMDADEKMPGRLEWRVGYFEKLQITKDQLDAQDVEPDIRSIQQLRDSVVKNVANKLREADRNKGEEADQQKTQDFEERSDNMISAAPPPQGFPSGIISIQIHNITGLALASLRKDRHGEGDEYSDNKNSETDDVPSSYATIVLNNKTIYKTRTKPKNTKPFFNAGTERFIRDWQNTELMVTVRDSRVHEDDPLLGFVYLPLEHILKERSQINETYPLSGGAGHGRVRISLMFRSVELKLPKEMLGWDLGTVEIAGKVTSEGLPQSLQKIRLTAKTKHGKGKLYHSSDNDGWTGKKDRKIWLAATSRYSSNVVFKFRTQETISNSTAAFAVLWLKDIPDDEVREVKLDVWEGKENFKRATTNCVQDLDDKVGTITVPVRFWPGLSEYHKPMAKKDNDIANIMEVNDAAADQNERDTSLPDDETDSSSGDSDDDKANDDLEEDGKRGPLSELSEYKKHSKILHRQNRGVMQWKAVRTNNWMRKKAQQGIEKLASNPFKHHERESGIETEV